MCPAGRVVVDAVGPRRQIFAALRAYLRHDLISAYEGSTDQVPVDLQVEGGPVRPAYPGRGHRDRRAFPELLDAAPPPAGGGPGPQYRREEQLDRPGHARGRQQRAEHEPADGDLTGVRLVNLDDLTDDLAVHGW